MVTRRKLESIGLHLRILKLAHTAKLLALNASGEVGITLDLLLSARNTGDRQSLSWLPRLGDTPMRIDHFSVNDRLTVTTIIVEVAEPFAWYLRLPNKARQELSTGPNLGSQAILGYCGVRGHGRGCRWVAGYWADRVLGVVTVRVSIHTVVGVAGRTVAIDMMVAIATTGHITEDNSRLRLWTLCLLCCGPVLLGGRSSKGGGSIPGWEIVGSMWI